MRANGQRRTGLARRLRDRLAPALLAAVLLTLPGTALAQDLVHGPCLAPQPDLAGYRAAFEAAGWTVAEGEARDQALRGPSETFRGLSIPPPVAETLEELEAQLADTHQWGREEFADALVLTKGDMAALVQIRPVDPHRRVICIVAAPKLQEVRQALMNVEAPLGPLRTYSTWVFYPPPLPGIADLRVDMTRMTRDIALPEPTPGEEAVTVTYTVEAPE